MDSRITEQDLMVAIAWLEGNEGTDGESEACRKIAAMLQKEIDTRFLKAAARRNGVSISNVRRAMERVAQSHG